MAKAAFLNRFVKPSSRVEPREHGAFGESRSCGSRPARCLVRGVCCGLGTRGLSSHLALTQASLRGGLPRLPASAQSRTFARMRSNARTRCVLYSIVVAERGVKTTQPTRVSGRSRRLNDRTCEDGQARACTELDAKRGAYAFQWRAIRKGRAISAPAYSWAALRASRQSRRVLLRRTMDVARRAAVPADAMPPSTRRHAPNKSIRHQRFGLEA